MSAVLKAQEPSARYLQSSRPPLVEHFDLLASAPGGVARLRELILTLAVRGKLVPQDTNNDPVTARLNEDGRRGVAGSSPSPIHHRLPSGWAWCPLGTLADVLDSRRQPVKRENRRPGPYPYYGASGAVDYVAEYIFDEPLVLVGEDGARWESGAATAFSISGKSWVNNHAHVLRPNRALILDSYLVVVLTAMDLSPYVTGMTVPKLNQGRLVTVPIPVPPLAEQARILARVEELMRLCDAFEAKNRLDDAQHVQLLNTLLGTLTDSASSEELAANWQRVVAHFDLLLDRPEAVDALEQTILQLVISGFLAPQCKSDESGAILLSRIRRSRRSKRRLIEADTEAIAKSGRILPPSWTWASADELSADSETAITDGPFGANLKTEHYVASNGFRVVRLQNIGAGVFRKEHQAYIDGERFEQLQRHRVFEGDIVVAGLVDESIRCCIVPPNLGPAIVKADCYRFAVHEAISSEFVCFYLSSKPAHEFASVHHHGLTLTRIGLGNFRSLPVPLPPVQEQHRIVARVNELRRLCADLRKRLVAQQTTQTHLAESLVESAAAA